jgi:hypothetical protein
MALWGQHKNPNIISANFTVVPAVDRQTDVRKQLPKYEKKHRPRADLAWKA